MFLRHRPDFAKALQALLAKISAWSGPVTQEHALAVAVLTCKLDTPPWHEELYDPDDPDDDHDAVEAERLAVAEVMHNSGYDTIKGWLFNACQANVVKQAMIHDAGNWQLLVIDAGGQACPAVYHAICEVVTVLATCCPDECTADYASFLCAMLVAFAQASAEDDLTNILYEQLQRVRDLLGEEDLAVLQKFGEENDSNVCGQLVRGCLQAVADAD